MHDPKFLRAHRERVETGVALKGMAVDLKRFYDLEERRLALLHETEQLKARRNAASEEIARRKKSGEDAARDIAEMREVGDRIKALDAELRKLQQESDALAAWIPNLPHASVPPGRDAAQNQQVRTWGEPRDFDFEPRPHWEIATRLGLLDFERAPKISGSGFLLFTGLGARLERALIGFMLDYHVRHHGYIEVSPPHLVRRQALFGTGQLPKLEADMYHVGEDDLFLNPTAEVPVTNIYREEILEPGQLPIYRTAHCASYRREAGAYGKETRGMVRVHQFDKVELVKIVAPETSYDEHETLAREVSAIFEVLELPYRVMLLCSGDLSFAAAKCYDFEVWSPGTKQWLECSSCSNFEDFQARRIDLRFRRERGAKAEHPHTLNASGVALPRTFAALLETHQTADGGVRIPPALRPYLDGLEEIALPT
ncbi:MAG: serine--tRNA ligase [Candidatus Eisenbacteria bacterium RBG_16_71_46]|nr:MAG: serine--tRNA ligase [Candidatus Eisenbacteria bacterium RBG_16_71_46]OGF22978.1 MAG: serine--tRNA ligase [Candidatus Eisenbacteria bacterium RBG_19FT_COMBO_70_11]